MATYWDPEIYKWQTAEEPWQPMWKLPLRESRHPRNLRVGRWVRLKVRWSPVFIFLPTTLLDDSMTRLLCHCINFSLVRWRTKNDRPGSASGDMPGIYSENVCHNQQSKRKNPNYIRFRKQRSWRSQLQAEREILPKACSLVNWKWKR